MQKNLARVDRLQEGDLCDSSSSFGFELLPVFLGNPKDMDPSRKVFMGASYV